MVQTPEFAEEFILDRTLTPATQEFGFRNVRLIDPTCGSGHFLLGAFHRLLALWVKGEPGRNIRDMAQQVLDAVAGVDINPFAVAIARFRLLVVALKACGINRRERNPFRTRLLAEGFTARQVKALIDAVIETSPQRWPLTTDDVPGPRSAVMASDRSEHGQDRDLQSGRAPALELQGLHRQDISRTCASQRTADLVGGVGFTQRHDDPEKLVDVAGHWNHVDKFRSCAPIGGTFAEALGYIDAKETRTIVIKVVATECQRSASFRL